MPRTIAFVVARIRRDAIGLATLRSSRSGPANAAARYRIRPDPSVCGLGSARTAGKFGAWLVMSGLHGCTTESAAWLCPDVRGLPGCWHYAMSWIFDRRWALAAERVKPAGIVAAVSSFPIRRSIEQRRVVLVAAVAMFAAVALLRQTSSDAADVVALLAAVPIALVALEFGLLVGVGAALVALGLVGVLAHDVHSGTVGLSTAAVAYLAIGAIAGRFGDRMRDAQARQHLLLKSGLALAHLDGAQDIAATLAQQAQEATYSRGARVELSGAPAVESGVVGQEGEQEHVAIELHGVGYGTLVLSGSRTLADEDRATLAILALQAGVAAENRRLLESERERAMIRAELKDARLHLAERGGQLRELMARVEAERGQVAHELHEDAAQVLAAVLLGLGALERELGSELSAPTLGELRSHINSTLQSLRSLAVSLRPPALQLGLRVALEELGDRARARGFGKVSVALEGTERLSPEIDIMVYRVVEETLEAVGAARGLSVRCGAERELVIEVQGARREIVPERLAILRARIELIGGTLAATASELHAIIPLPAGRGGFAAAA
jgi:signal transduction histidine kinase